MQRQKIFFTSLVVLGSLVAGYFSLMAAFAIFDFCTMRENTPATIVRWEIKETKGKFPIRGYYSFEANGALWHGSTRLSGAWHLNEPAAIAALKEEAKQNWIAWYNPKDPARSSLEKQFPYSLVLRALICYAVLVYFILFFRNLVKNIYN